jgi:hypothetical protein
MAGHKGLYYSRDKWPDIKVYIIAMINVIGDIHAESVT